MLTWNLLSDVFESKAFLALFNFPQFLEEMGEKKDNKLGENCHSNLL